MYGSETWEITDILVEQISKCQHIMERWILGCEVGVIEIPNSWVKTAHRISGDLIKNPEISEKSGEMVGLILRVSLAVFEMHRRFSKNFKSKAKKKKNVVFPVTRPTVFKSDSNPATFSPFTLCILVL
ncbi:hypothetical protein GQR58_023428 [Nymphon striatum]|nr:hypothetical protein GQR58_023428 [Nymphon striatum]